MEDCHQEQDMGGADDHRTVPSAGSGILNATKPQKKMD